jgi:hypothetical protein
MRRGRFAAQLPLLIGIPFLTRSRKLSPGGCSQQVGSNSALNRERVLTLPPETCNLQKSQKKRPT